MQISKLTIDITKLCFVEISRCKSAGANLNVQLHLMFLDGFSVEVSVNLEKPPKLCKFTIENNEIAPV